MKKLHIILLLSINVILTSCSLDSSGNASIASWFWVALVLFILVIVVGGLIETSGTKTVNEALAKDGINPEDFRSCGNYVGGHPLINRTVNGVKIRKDNGKLNIYEYPFSSSTPKYLGKIEINLIKDILVEDASSIEKRITLGRLLLVGVFAFAWKKNKKNEMAFVTITWKEKFDYNATFCFEGKDARHKANVARSQLISLVS